MSTNSINNKSAALIKNAKLLHVAKPDTGATAAMKELGAANRGAGSVSGKEMMDAIVKGTKDFDNHSASSEFAAISKWVEQNASKLSPEAKKVFDVYAKAAKKAQAGGHSGIDFRAYQAMQREMRSAATVKAHDASAGKALQELARNNKTPGSISGKEMMDAIVKGTKDFDNQSAGAEFDDIAKFVRENRELLSPEAKKAFAVYEKAVLAAKAQGQTGMPLDKFNRMVRDMMRAIAPPPAQPPPPPPVQTQPAPPPPPVQTQPAPPPPPVQTQPPPPPPAAAPQPVYGGAPPPPMAGTPSAEQGGADANFSIPIYAQPAPAPAPAPAPVVTAPPAPPVTPAPAPAPYVPDASVKQALDALGAANTKPGSISGEELTRAIIEGTKDLDNSSAGKEFNDVAAWVKKNAAKLSPEAKAAFAIYERHAKAHASKGETGIPLPEFKAMEKEMLAASKPRYADTSAASALNGLAAANKTPGSISAKELTDAIVRGTRDGDNQAAGTELRDIEKFVRENEQLLSPQAKKALDVYLKHAKAHQAKGETGIPLGEFNRMVREMRAVGAQLFR